MQGLSVPDGRIPRHFAAFQRAGGHISLDDFLRFAHIIIAPELKRRKKFALSIALILGNLSPRARPDETDTNQYLNIFSTYVFNNRNKYFHDGSHAKKNLFREVLMLLTDPDL